MAPAFRASLPDSSTSSDMSSISSWMSVILAPQSGRPPLPRPGDDGAVRRPDRHAAAEDYRSARTCRRRCDSHLSNRTRTPMAQPSTSTVR